MSDTFRNVITRSRPSSSSPGMAACQLQQCSRSCIVVLCVGDGAVVDHEGVLCLHRRVFHALQAIYGSEEPKRPTEKASSVWQKMKNEPVLLFVAIYNPMQVGTDVRVGCMLMQLQVLLCGYMAYGVIAEMIDKKYAIFCNDFVPVRLWSCFCACPLQVRDHRAGQRGYQPHDPRGPHRGRRGAPHVQHDAV